MRPFFQQLTEQRQRKVQENVLPPNVLNDKVLVGAGSTPCTLQFRFENSQSSMLERVTLSYRIQVTPPSVEMVMEGRRRRGNACLKVLDADLHDVAAKLENISRQTSTVQQELDSIQSEYKTMMEEWKSVRSREAALRKEAGLREPIKYMNDFLQN